MDLIKVAEIDNYLQQQLNICPLDVLDFVSDRVNLKELPVDFKNDQIVICAKYLDDLDEWVNMQDRKYLQKIAKGIEEISELVKQWKISLYKDFYINFDDFVTDFAPHLRPSQNGRGIVDVNTGYPLDEYQEYIFLAANHNPRYNETINVLGYLFNLLIDGLQDTVNNVHNKKLAVAFAHLEETKTETPGIEITPSHKQETDLDTIILAEATGHKILLLHELGIIDYLIKKYNQNDITDIATLLSFITGINHNTVRSGIRQYKTQGKGDIYNRKSVTAINKTLLDAKMTPIEFKKA